MARDQARQGADQKIEEARRLGAKELRLHHIGLHIVPPELAQLTNLTTLDLRGNQLTSVPRELAHLANLTTLHLGYNRLTNVPGELRRLANLTTLNLSANELTGVPPELGHLTNLTTLNLSDNQLPSIPAELGHLTKLTTLYLGSNRLTSVPAELGQSTNLTMLALGSNQLMSIPAQLGQLTNLTTLSLSHNQLTRVPAELDQLANLTTLNLSGNRLTSIPPELGQLANLTTLNLSGNQLTSIPPELGQLANLTTLDLGGNQLTSIPPELRQLTNLSTLDLSANELTGIPPKLAQLTNLSTLNLSNNQLTSVPAELEYLTKLTTLDLGGNHLTSVPAELGQLTNLSTLDLSANELTGVPPELGQLTNLTRLELRANRIESLPRSLLDLIADLKWEMRGNRTEWGVFLSDNPLTNPPVEVIKQGNHAVRQWFEALTEEGGERLNEVKVLLVGYGGAGKTSLARRLTTNKFRPDEVKTHGVKIRRWPVKIDGEKATVHLWDYGGQGIMQATHRVFFSRRTLYMLVIDARQESDPEEWLSNIETMGGDSPILVVVNKTDEHAFGLNETGLHRQYPSIKCFYHVSCKTGDGIALLRRDLPRHLGAVEMTKMTWPRRHAAVKERLARLRRDYITYADYQSICSEEGVHDLNRQKELIHVLHELGAMLHFSDRHLPDAQVLNPEWVTGGIYKLLNSPTLKYVEGKLPRDELDYVLNQERLLDDVHALLQRRPHYSPQEQTYIVELMNRFGLCYDLGEHTILVPDLLTEQEPAKGLPEKADLRFYFEYDFLPASVLPRLMVESSSDLVADLCWRTGAVLRSSVSETTAVVRKQARFRRITVEVSGQQPRDYFGSIRETISRINRSFEKLRVVEWVPLTDKKQGPAVKYLDLIGHEAAGVREKFVGELGKGFSVAELLGTIETQQESKRRIQDIIGEPPLYIDQRGATIEEGVHMGRSLRRKTRIKGNVTASPIAEGAHVHTGDITVIDQNIDNLTTLNVKDKRKLKRAADELSQKRLENGDRRDAEYHLGQIVHELSESKPNESRLRKLWGYFNDNAPGIAATLQTISLIAQLTPK